MLPLFSACEQDRESFGEEDIHEQMSRADALDILKTCVQEWACKTRVMAVKLMLLGCPHDQRTHTARQCG